MNDSNDNTKINSLISKAYEQLIRLFNINEDSSIDSVYQTIVATKGDSLSYYNAYINYYMGVFEGIFISLFLEEFSEYPNKSQKEFIQNSFEKRFHDFIAIVKDYAIKQCKKDQGS